MDLKTSSTTNPFMDQDLISTTSTPFTSAPSSPNNNNTITHTPGYYFSCPASPTHYLLSLTPATPPNYDSCHDKTSGAFEFFGTPSSGRMIPADEIFLNGKIRPLKLSLAPLPDLEDEEEDKDEELGRGRELRGRSRSSRRRTRSMSPIRSPRVQWEEVDEHVSAVNDHQVHTQEESLEKEENEAAAAATTITSSRNSRRWIFLKDLLYRSKSEGSGRGDGNGKEQRFWHSISFRSKAAAMQPSTEEEKGSTKAKGSGNGVRRQGKPPVSAHEKHYTASRAQAEEMRRRTFLPYRQGLLGCLGFNSRSYGAIHGFAKALNPVSSR